MLYICGANNNLCKFLGERPMDCVGSCLNKEKCEFKKTVDKYDKEYLLKIIVNNMGLTNNQNDYYYLKGKTYNDNIPLGFIPSDKLLSSLLITIYETGYKRGEERGKENLASEIRYALGIQNKEDD